MNMMEDNDTEKTPNGTATVLDKQDARQAETRTGMPMVLGGGIILAVILLGLIYAFFL
jgi:hypothetical protein